MNEDKWGLYGLVIGIIEFNLNLFLYIYLKSITIIIWVLLGSFAVIVLIILTDKFNKIDKNQIKINNLDKRFKTLQELDDIRLDVRELKRKVFKNE